MASQAHLRPAVLNAPRTLPNEVQIQRICFYHEYSPILADTFGYIWTSVVLVFKLVLSTCLKHKHRGQERPTSAHVLLLWDRWETGYDKRAVPMLRCFGRNWKAKVAVRTSVDAAAASKRNTCGRRGNCDAERADLSHGRGSCMLLRSAMFRVS